MRLIYKTILIALAVIVTFGLLLSMIASSQLKRSYESLENRIAIENLNRIVHAIDDRLKSLEKSTADWGIWDDTYNFIETRDRTYIDLNLSHHYLISMDLGLIALFNDTDELVVYSCVDTESAQSVELDGSDIWELQKFIQMPADSEDLSYSGLITLKGRLVLLASYPILRSDTSGPSRGTIIQGRWLNNSLVNEIAHSTRLNLAIQSYSNAALYGLSGESLHSLLSGSQTMIVKPDLHTLNAYQLVNDFKNSPVLIIQLAEPRDIYTQGRKTITWLHTVILALTIIFVCMAVVMIYQMIIHRLQRLTSGLQKVSESHDLTLRMPVDGRDEIALLAAQTNNTLQQIAVFQGQLQVSEEKFRKISEFAQDVIYQVSLSPVLCIEYISPSVEKILGYSVAEVTHEPERLFNNLHPDDRTKLAAYIDQLPKDVEKKLILRWRQKSGSLVWIEHVNSMINMEGGKPVKIIGAGRNVTERIKMENQIVELYQKEKEMRQELEKEAKARGYFINVLGHELKTPMTPLMISLDMLKENSYPPGSPLQTRLIINAVESVKILGNRLDELLDLARFARGTFKLEKTVFDVRIYLEKMIERIEPVLESRGQKLKVDLLAVPGQILADPFRLEQVISNLLSNASKYSDEGQEIEFRASEENGQLVVEVEDHGIGISAEEQKRLFEPFHRVEQDRQRFAGLGLGLAVARQIVEAHGGELTVSSFYNRGSIFRFTIPVDLN